MLDFQYKILFYTLMHFQINYIYERYICMYTYIKCRYTCIHIYSIIYIYIFIYYMEIFLNILSLLHLTVLHFILLYTNLKYQSDNSGTHLNLKG